ncbi:MAG: hypothetical protein AABZ35_06635 [Gemmatimonadota bacterium]
MKTQRALSSADALLVLLYRLVATGQLPLRRLPGFQELPQVLARQAT